mgnify:FL=1
MIPPVIISPELLDDLGLLQVLDACQCRSPQGNILKNAAYLYTPISRDSLQEELSAIDRLLSLVRANHPQLTEAQIQLSRLRELRGTLGRLEKGNLLDDTEFFELKSALSIFNRIRKMKELVVAAGVDFEDTKAAAALLDPAGTGNPAFYIYSDYSTELTQIRARKIELERAIRQATGSQRKALLTQRALITAQEDQEEENIRRQLGVKLAEWLPQIRKNLDNCGILDFRLAKAILAARWNGCRPKLVEREQPAILQNAIHPLVAAMLEKQGLSFTPISIELQQGTTVLMGANMGGKSVALKTVFLALLMTQLGYFPICESLQTPLFDFFAFESSFEGDLHRGLSSFGLEAVQIRNHYQKSQNQKGLILMDEPCRGTNPSEATAIVQALCNVYGKSSSTFFIATHYHVKPAPGIRFYQVRGISPEALAELPTHRELPVKTRESEDDSADGFSSLLPNVLHEDLTRVRRIQNLMDYRLEEMDGIHQTPSSAIKIAELLGVDEALLREMKAARQEE